MSWASARRDGRRRTRCRCPRRARDHRCRSTGRPRRRRPDPTTASASGSGVRPLATGVGCSDADRAVQPRPHLGRHVVAAVDDRRRPRIGAARLGLLVVGEGQHPQREDLVDLGRVVEVAGALGRDLGVVVEDDRRRQHHVAVADEHRERAVVRAARRPRPARRRGGSSSDTKMPSSTASRCARRRASGGSTSSRGRVGRRDQSVTFSTSTTTFRRAPSAVGPVRARARSVDRLAPAHDAPDRRSPSAARSYVSTSLAGGKPERCSRARVERGEQRSRRCRPRARPPRPTAQDRCRRRRAGRLGEAVSRRPRRLDGAPLHLEAPHPHGERAASRRGRRCTRCASSTARSRRLGVRAWREHAELPAHLVLRAPTRGTGRARSPRTAPRRRRRVRAANRSMAGDGHAPSSPASLRSRSTAWSQVGSARRP